MGSLFSKIFKKHSGSIETCEEWDEHMQELQEKQEEIVNSKKKNKRLLSIIKVLVFIAFLSLFLLSYLLYRNYIIFYYPLADGLLMIILYLYERILIRALKRLDEEDIQVAESIKKHIDALSNVKACYPDISRLALKYNINTRVLNSKEVECLNKDIQALLQVIRQLIELPLCKDCRYYTGDERHRVLDQIPPQYASLFTNVEPRKAEDVSKPLDEKLMSLLGDDEEGPVVVQKIMMLENKPEEEIAEEVTVEEIMEEEEESEVRQRHVMKNDESCVCCQTKDKRSQQYKNRRLETNLVITGTSHVTDPLDSLVRRLFVDL